MNKWIFFIAFLFMGLIQTDAQLKFNTYSKQLIAQAKAENKLIFYEFTASWCAPCKEMKKEVFPDTKVGSLYNKNFVCIQIDVDKDPHNISDNYDVSGIPAFVFADASGKVIHSETGYHTVDEFIDLAEIPLAYQNGNTTPVQDLLIAYDNDPENFEKKLQAFMDSDDWKNEEGAMLLIALADNGQESAVEHFEKNESTYIKLLGQNHVDTYHSNAALNEIADKLDAAVDNREEPDWTLVENALKTRLGNRYLKHLYDVKSMYAIAVEDWVNYVKYTARAADEYAKYARDDVDKGEIYLEFSFTIIENELDLEETPTDAEEIEVFKILYPLLQKAEKFVETPSSDLYTELAYACSVLGLENEEFKYDDLTYEALKREEQQK